MDIEPQQHNLNNANDYFECYAEFAKTLRTWLIAYGIGAPILFLSNESLWSAIKSSCCTKSISGFFLSGVFLQVFGALLYKNAMWYLYRGEENPQIKNKFQYKAFYKISEFYLLEIILDIGSLICFALATYKVFCILT